MMKYLRIAVMMLAAVLMTGCSDDGGGEQLLVPQNTLVKRMWEGYRVTKIKPQTTRNHFSLKIGRNLATSNGNGDYQGQWFSAESNTSHFAALLKRYGDTGMTGELPGEAKDYIPHAWGFTHIQCDYWKRDQASGRLTRYDLSDTEDIKIRFKTYAGYIANGYKWDDGVYSPWLEMTLKEFNEKAPFFLVDVVNFTLDISTDNELRPADDPDKEYRQQLDFTFCFESGFYARYSAWSFNDPNRPV